MSVPKKESKKPKKEKPEPVEKPTEEAVPPASNRGVRFYLPKRGKAGTIWTWINVPKPITLRFKNREKTGTMSEAVRGAWENHPDKSKVPTSVLGPQSSWVRRAIVFPKDDQSAIQKWIDAGNDFDAYVYQALLKKVDG